MQRVMILGCGGSGKSTLARAIGTRSELPVVHLDSLFWKPGWIESTREEFAAKHDAAVAGERWVVDGNYSRTFERRVAAADTVIVLDLPRRTCMRGILWRWLRNRGRTRPDMPAGCPERIDWVFIKWVWTFRARSRQKHLSLADSLRDTKNVHIFTSRRAAYRWLDGVPAVTRR